MVSVQRYRELLVSQIGREIPQKNINKKQSNPQKNVKNNQSFNGGIDTAFNVLDSAFKVLDKNAMVQVAFVDSVATDIPRTLVDLKTGLAAALETARREFSGLIVNCLIPSFIVMGVAKLLPKKGDLADTGVVKSWANGDVADKLSSVFNKAQLVNPKETTKTYVQSALSSLEGLDGKTWVKYADKADTPEFKEAVEVLTQAITKPVKERKGLLKTAQQKLSSVTKAENILKFNGKPQANLEETLRDVVDMGSKFNVVKQKTLSGLGKTVDDVANPEVASKIEESIKNYSKSLNKFVTKKSLIGLGLVIGLAVSIQKINRAITKKQFNAEGAPIYKDFGKKDTTQKMDEKQKKKFFGKKLLAAGGMIGMAALSMMKKPTLGMFQFSNIFPTLDQCRWIASSTFASRMLSAEDENELRESTVRDIASFAGLYFLGDYVKKGVASGFEALSKTKKGAKLLGENVVLLNRKKEVAKPVLKQGASILEKVGSQVGYRAKQFGNWIKNTDLKTAAEVASKSNRNLRNLCRVADIAFSIVMLGILLPRYNRKVTEKKVAAAKLKEEQQAKAIQNNVVTKNTPEIFKEFTK